MNILFKVNKIFKFLTLFKNIIPFIKNNLIHNNLIYFDEKLL
jgi:hypothetical protein